MPCLKYDFLVLFPLNPARLASYRAAVTNSGAKDDPTDAELLLEYLACHRNHLRAWEPDDALTRQISMLVEARRQAVDLRTQLSNQLRAQLKMYFPQAFELAGNTLHHRMACDFLIKWPTLGAVQKASPQSVRKFYYGHRSRQEQLIARRLQLIREARPLEQ